MKTPFVIATGIVCWLGGGYGNYVLAEDLDSALEKINISTEAQNAPKKTDKVSVPCAKTTEVNCTNVQEGVNKNAYEASAIQGAMTGGLIPRVTINGVSVGELPNKGAVSVGGF